MLRAVSRSSRASPSRYFATTSLRRNTRPPSTDSTPPTPLQEEPDKQALASKPEPAPAPSPEVDSTSPSESSSQYDLETVKTRLLGLTDRAAITLRTKADDFTSTTKVTFSQLGAKLNKVTGYDEIEALKRLVVSQEERIKATRQDARTAKLQYDEAVAKRSNSQREANDLLQRKSTWTDYDVSRFTALVREDHMLEQEEARAKIAVDESEDAQDREFSELMRAILARYHEEQVWSDKIRSASTYGQLAVLALNLLVFISAIVFVEPWKRKRLAQTFENKTEELSVETREMVEKGIGEVKEELQDQVRVLTILAEAALKAERDRELATKPVSFIPLQTPGFQDRAILSGIAAGSVVAALISWILYT